jgi:hypothetical protein
MRWISLIVLGNIVDQVPVAIEEIMDEQIQMINGMLVRSGIYGEDVELAITEDIEEEIS